MRLARLQAAGLVCPTCREGEVFVSRALREAGGELEEGILQCARAACCREFPVLDGIPILVPDLRRLVSEQLLGVFGRDDLSETLVAALAEGTGPSSALDVTRQHLSTYVAGHWGDLDPGERNPGERPGSVVAILARGLERLAGRGAGPALDVGCSVGRTSAELAARTSSDVVGVDLNFSMLRTARRALRSGRVRYARRRSGLIYEERDFPVSLANAERVELVCADALALPFRDGSFGLATSLNLLDCVPSPLDHLRGLARVVRPGGAALVATPFDWSPSATEPQAWLGGHSPRGPAKGSPVAVARAILGGDHAVAVAELELLAEEHGLEWSVRLHDRAVMRYDVDLFVVGRRDVPRG